MKKNFISAIAGWKSAALLALVAMVAAVAFSGVLTNTETADAQVSVQPVGTDADGVSVPAGTTVIVAFGTGDGDRFRFSPDSAGTATFVANGATSLTCGDYDSGDTGGTDGANATIRNAACDVNPTDTEVSVLVKVDDDSPIGEIYVQRYVRPSGGGDPTTVTEALINVVRADPPTAIQLVGAPPASISMAGDAARNITVRLVKGDASGVGSQSLNVITTAGALNTDGSGVCTAAADAATAVTNPRAFCAITTSSDAATAGQATISLFGNGLPGKATVTISLAAPALSLETSVVLHGPVDSITAEAQQSSIQVGGATFIVVTISDAAGNPIPSKGAAVATNVFGSKKITPPETPQSVAAQRVVDNPNLDFDPNKNREVNRGDIPACGNHGVDPDAAIPDVTSTNLQAAGADVPAGTNAAGQCVIQVRAPLGPPAGTDSASATRGAHTVTVRADDLATKPAKEVSVEIHVGGAPASIETDAPARVDSLSSTAVTVTVLDDEGVRVGAVPISVVQVEGSGNVDAFPGQGTDAGASTSDGRATFTYLAPLSAGEAVFLIRVNPGTPAQVQSTVTVAIGDAPEEAPEAPPATWNNDLVSGQNLVVWNGADGADPSDGAADGVSAIWSYYTGSGSWDGYFPDAADVPGGNTLTSLSNGQAYVVIVD